MERKATELEKQRERERLRKEKRPKKPKKKMGDDEEEEQMIDNTDKDKDYNPEEDAEAEFVAKDQELEDEDTFEVEKHVHALNFEEASKYLVAMNQFMEAFTKIIRRGKDDMKREYKKLIKFVKLMIKKLGAYSPNESVDTDAVFKTIVDPQCVAWRRQLHGTKTSNSKEIQLVEEKRWKVERAVEEREIDLEMEVKTFADTMQVKSKSVRADVVQMIKRYFEHVAKVHKEAACVAKLAQLLIEEVDENTWLQIVTNSTRPLIMMEVPEMLRQASSMKTEHEQQQRVEQLKGLPIKEIVREQNMPCPVKRWTESKIMSPSSHLAAAVYFFLYNTGPDEIGSKSSSSRLVQSFNEQFASHHQREKIFGRKYTGVQKVQESAGVRRTR